MVFSLFKKTKPSDNKPNTVPRTKAVVPPAPASVERRVDSSADGVATLSPLDSAPASKLPETRSVDSIHGAPTLFPDDDLGSLDFSGLEVTDICQLGGGTEDPLQATLEQVAMLYASGADAQVAKILAEARAAHPQGDLAERLWLMQLDLCQVLNQRGEFDQLAMDFARAFEKSPPTWLGPEEPCRPVSLPPGALQFKGGLEEGNDEGFAPLQAALDQSKRGDALIWDFSRVTLIDPAGCTRLAACFDQARQRKIHITLSGVDRLLPRLLPRCEAGKREAEGCWLLLLNLLALSGDTAAFEEKAVDYAITFEVSPPAWEPVKAVPGTTPASLVPAEEEVFCLAGSLAGERFAGLAEFAAPRNPVVIDLARVPRMDFASAGALLNAITPLKTAGKTVVVRGAHRLLVELLTLVGVTAVAQVIPPKR